MLTLEKALHFAGEGNPSLNSFNLNWEAKNPAENLPKKAKARVFQAVCDVFGGSTKRRAHFRSRAR